MLLAGFGLMATGWEEVRQGTPALLGDSYSGGAGFKATCSIVLVLAAGLVEEAILRAQVQLRIEPVVGALASQLIAGVIFIALHALTGLGFRQLLYLLTLSIVAGVLTSRYRSAIPAALAHSVSNLGIALTILIMRL